MSSCAEWCADHAYGQCASEEVRAGEASVCLIRDPGRAPRVVVDLPDPGTMDLADARSLAGALLKAVGRGGSAQTSSTSQAPASTCRAWCFQHDADTEQCVSAPHEGGRVGVWLVAEPGSAARLAVDAPPSGCDLTMDEAALLVRSMSGLMELAGSAR